MSGKYKTSFLMKFSLITPSKMLVMVYQDLFRAKAKYLEQETKN